MRLSSKLRVSYVGIILLSVSLVLVLIIENSQRELKEKITNDFVAIAKIEAENIDHFVNGKLIKVRELALDKIFSSGSADDITRYLTRVRRDDPDLSDFSLLDTSRRTVVSTDPALSGRTWSSDLELVSKASGAEPGEVFFKYGYGKAGSLQCITFVRTQAMDKDRATYVLAVSIDIKRILKDGGDSKTLAGKVGFLLNNQSTMVITRDGDAQIFSPLVYIQEDSVLGRKDSLKRNGHVTYKDPLRGAVMAGYAYLNENTPETGRWSVISMAPEKEVFYPSIRLRNNMMILGSIAVAVAWVLAFFVARGIARPIKRLVEVTDLIAGGDLSQRADIRSDDEVGDLARSFNKMTDKLNIAIVARDQEIIERRNAEERLKEEMQAKAKFISLISNEFQTPLTVIREGIGAMMADGGAGMTPRQKEILQISKKGGESLAHLVSDIVHFHSLEAEIIKMQFEKNDMNGVVKEVHKNMLPFIAEKKDIKFELDLAPALPLVDFDRERIALVLANIINIALFTTDKGSISVRTRIDGDNALCVTVEDNGSTIDKEYLPTLFDKFDRPGKDKDKKAGGTGLGLTISREIVKKHNGKIWAEPSKNGGVEISFVLPLNERRE